MFDFDVRQCGHAAGAPIDQPLSSINQFVFIETDENFQDGFRQSFVHRKTKAIPVAGFAKPFLLTNNGIS